MAGWGRSDDLGCQSVLEGDMQGCLQTLVLDFDIRTLQSRHISSQSSGWSPFDQMLFAGEVKANAWFCQPDQIHEEVKNLGSIRGGAGQMQHRVTIVVFGMQYTRTLLDIPSKGFKSGSYHRRGSNGK